MTKVPQDSDDGQKDHRLSERRGADPPEDADEKAGLGKARLVLAARTDPEQHWQAQRNGGE
jgi:hypothetical protein